MTEVKPASDATRKAEEPMEYTLMDALRASAGLPPTSNAEEPKPYKTTIAGIPCTVTPAAKFDPTLESAEEPPIDFAAADSYCEEVLDPDYPGPWNIENLARVCRALKAKLEQAEAEDTMSSGRLAQLGTILEWISLALQGATLSEWALSFPMVREASDLRAKLERSERQLAESEKVRESSALVINDQNAMLLAERACRERAEARVVELLILHRRDHHDEPGCELCDEAWKHILTARARKEGGGR